MALITSYLMPSLAVLQPQIRLMQAHSAVELLEVMQLHGSDPATGRPPPNALPPKLPGRLPSPTTLFVFWGSKTVHHVQVHATCSATLHLFNRGVGLLLD